jgi:hypothetical protein
MRRLNMKTVTTLVLFMLLALQLTATAETLLVVRQGSENFKEVLDSLKEEIDGDFEIVDEVLSKDSTYEKFAARVREVKPNLLVLLDNQAVGYAKKFNQESDDYAKNLRGVAAMGLNLRKELEGNVNISAVEYEVPAYTLITSYRFIVTKEVKNVLVFYRGSQHAEMIKVATEQLAKEGIALKAMDAEEFGTTNKDVNFFLQRNLLRELYRKDLDLVWVMSDSVLLNNDNFAEVWVSAARRNKIPFITGIKAFAEKDMGFCVYSASPNHKDLGVQIAQQIFALMDDEEMKADELGIEYILSVQKNINPGKIDEHKIELNKENMNDVKVNK